MIPFKIPWKKTIVLAGVSALSLFIIFKTTVHVENFLDIISRIDLRYFWLAFATLIPTVFLNAARWYFVLKAAGHQIPYRRVFFIVLNSTSLMVIPGRLGDLARAYPLRNTVPPEQAIGTIVLEKIVDVATLLLFSGFGLFLLRFYRGSAVTLIAAAMVFPALMISGRIIKARHLKERVTAKLFDGFAILNQVRHHRFIFLLAITSSILNMGLSMVQFYWLLIAVHASVSLSAIFAFLPLCIFVGLIPLTLAGTGTRDAALIYFFSAYALSGQVLSAGILYALQGYWILSFLCLPLLYLFFKRSTSD